ncbi:MAG: hypothetical protein ACKOA7_04995, partial [Bacteroidota bacterium]
MRWIFLLVVLLFWIGVDLYFFQAVKTLFRSNKGKIIRHIYIVFSLLLYALIGVSIAFNGHPTALNYKNLVVSVLFIGLLLRLLSLPCLLFASFLLLLLFFPPLLLLPFPSSFPSLL